MQPNTYRSELQAWGKKPLEAKLESALELTASKQRAAKEAAAAARLKEAHQAAPKPSGEPQISPRQSATSPARGKATKKKLRSLAPKAGQIPPVRTARMDQTEADSWHGAVAQFQDTAGALTPATLGPPLLTLIL